MFLFDILAFVIQQTKLKHSTLWILKNSLLWRQSNKISQPKYYITKLKEVLYNLALSDTKKWLQNSLPI